MKLFLDTSVLIKKYVVAEPGAQRLAVLLAESSAVVVAPVTWIEMHHACYRLAKDGYLDEGGLKGLLGSLKKDYAFFHVVSFNEPLEDKAVGILAKTILRSPDAIQLAAAMTSASDVFCTADKKLYEAARKHLKRAELVL